MKHIDWHYESNLPRKNNNKVYKTLCSKYVKSSELDNENPECDRCKVIYKYAKSLKS